MKKSKKEFIKYQAEAVDIDHFLLTKNKKIIVMILAPKEKIFDKSAPNDWEEDFLSFE